MKEKNKTIIYVQYILFSLLSFLLLFLPYIHFSISASLTDKINQSKKWTGYELLRFAFCGEKKIPFIEELFADKLDSVRILIICFILLPLILMAVNALIHGISMVKGKYTKKLSILPGIILFMCCVGMIGIKIFFNEIKNELTNAASEGISLFLGGELGNWLENAASNLVTIKLSFGVGYFLTLLLAVVLFLQDMFLLGRFMKKEEFVPDAIYREKKTKGKDKEEKEEIRAITTWNKSDIFENPVYSAERKDELAVNDTGDPTVKASVYSGRLIGIRGEYAGAEIQIQSGETIYIGRSQEHCSLILNNSKVSRKHCSVTYDEKENGYRIVNYSLNGTYLSGGQLLKQDKIYHLPHGTMFRVDEENEFKVL